MEEEVTHVIETAQGIVLLTLQSEDENDAPIGGLLLIDANDEQETAREILTTNETLSALWCSPAGHLWVGCADGRVATTAPVGWAAPSRQADYRAHNGSRGWTVATLPVDSLEGLPPNILKIHGSGDDDVHVGTHGGHLYHWNGKAWRQTHQGDGTAYQSIVDIKGHGRDSVFAIGTRDMILHFDGAQWRKLPTPGSPNEGESFGGIALLTDGSVLICSAGDEGRLLHGGASGFIEFGRYPLQLNDVVTLGDRVLFAIWDGVAELVGRDVQVIKSNFLTAHAFEGRGRVFFTEPANPGIHFIVHDPAASPPWKRRNY
ncbi:hypothetical protein [Roseateles sp. L2-2]|uniref:hypothetical protein n=1 Tax=Roseateles sp. L2-2 TaxID=3422597 RepID=UPI003D36EF3B